MRRLLNVIILTLALNFLAVAGGVAYLAQTGRLDHSKVMQVKDLLFPPPEPTVELATTQPVDQATTQPFFKLEELLARKTGHTARETVDFLQETFDAQMVQLDRRRRELDDLQRQIELAKQQLASDREQLDKGRMDLEAQRQQAARLASDEGFQDSLTLYESLPGKQVKTIFMGLDEDVVVQYLQSMSPSAAKKILKEFKTPDEIERAKHYMEKMRLPPTASAKE